MSDQIRISEIFGPTIQGEGHLIGQPTIFVRTGGCDYRCSWCDTLHAVDSRFRENWSVMSSEDIIKEIETLSKGRPMTVTLSGGNPAIQDLSALIRLGRQKGYSFTMETQGSVSQPWFAELDLLTLSPKPPSSGQTMDWLKLMDCIRCGPEARTVLKIVVFDREDYEFARVIHARHPVLPIYIQPGNEIVGTGNADEPAVDQGRLMKRMREMVEWVSDDHWKEVRVLPQLHVMLWGNMKGV